MTKKYMRMVIHTANDTYRGVNHEYSDKVYAEWSRILNQLDNLDHLSIYTDDNGSKMFFPGTLLKNSVAFIEVFDKI
jgi:hypothetical protein